MIRRILPAATRRLSPGSIALLLSPVRVLNPSTETSGSAALGGSNGLIDRGSRQEIGYVWRYGQSRPGDEYGARKHAYRT